MLELRITERATLHARVNFIVFGDGVYDIQKPPRAIRMHVDCLDKPVHEDWQVVTIRSLLGWLLTGVCIERNSYLSFKLKVWPLSEKAVFVGQNPGHLFRPLVQDWL